MPEPLPLFKYHPDAIATGMVVASDTPCVCCGRVRGYVYTGPVYSEEEHDDEICPWCIADGSAHEKLDAAFTDRDYLTGYGPVDVACDVADEVAYHTPGFSGWQQERWWAHCGDAAQFLNVMGREELGAIGPAAVAAIRSSADVTDAQWAHVFAALDKDDSPRAYLFRCSKCGQLGGYWDCD